MGIATRLAALEKRARSKGYRVGPPKKEAPLPEGMVEIDGLIYYEMGAEEQREVITLFMRDILPINGHEPGPKWFEEWNEHIERERERAEELGFRPTLDTAWSMDVVNSIWAELVASGAVKPQATAEAPQLDWSDGEREDDIERRLDELHADRELDWRQPRWH